MDFIALDVETAIGKRWSICQIGLAIVRNGEIIETISELIKPPDNEYSHWNTRIHGIGPDDTVDKPVFPEIWAKYSNLFTKNRIVAHNASFDISCLRQTLEYYNIDVPNFEYACTYELSGLKLSEACSALNINLEYHHDAGCDAVACAKIFLQLQSGTQVDFNKFKNTAKKNPRSYEVIGHERICGDLLQPDLENADPSSPFYDKKVVFTGALNGITRKEAAEIVKRMGADIDSSITKRTNYVIMGSNPGASKMNKIIRYNNEGFEIKIIYERDFLCLIESKL